MSNFSNYVKLARPNHYIKNLFVILPLFFAGKILDWSLLSKAIFAFIAFSLVASAIYILNDYRDIDSDRKHPKKKQRPLASGSVSKTTSLIIMVSLVVIGLTIMTSLNTNATLILVAYIMLNIAYCFKLKQIAIVDVSCIATGFVFRLFIGAIVTSVDLSIWIVILTFLLALFLGLAKRRDDLLIFVDTGEKMRKVVDGYNLQFIDAAMTIMGSVVIVAYIFYAITASETNTIAHHTEYLYLTSVFVVLGILRYLQISFVEQNSGSPTTALLKDGFLQIVLLGWSGTYIWMLYL